MKSRPARHRTPDVPSEWGLVRRSPPVSTAPLPDRRGAGADRRPGTESRYRSAVFLPPWAVGGPADTLAGEVLEGPWSGGTIPTGYLFVAFSIMAHRIPSMSGGGMVPATDGDCRRKGGKTDLRSAGPKRASPGNSFAVVKGGGGAAALCGFLF